LAYLINKEPQQCSFWHAKCQHVKLPLFSANP
jgi:hypothetical protein